MEQQRKVTHNKKTWWSYKDVFEERPDQKEIFLDPTIRKVIIAGRRYGKSVLMAESCIKVAVQTDRANNWIVAPTYSILMEAFWSPIKQRLAFLGYNVFGDKNKPKDCKVNNELKQIEIINVHGTWSKITLKSADKEQGLVGSGLDFLGIDEFRYIKKNVWEEQLLPTLVDYDGNLMVTSTIKKNIGSLWALYDIGNIENKERYRPGWKSWKFNTDKNPYVIKEVVDDFKYIMSSKMHNQEFFGQVENDGLVYCLYNPEIHLKELEIDYSLPIRLSFDFNFSLQTTSVSQIVDCNPEYLELKAKFKECKDKFEKVWN